MALDNLQSDHKNEEDDAAQKSQSGNQFFRSAFFLHCKQIQISASSKCSGQSVGLAALQQDENNNQSRIDH